MRKLLAVIVVVALAAAMMIPASAANTDGLVGFYKFEGNLNNEVEGGAAGEAIGFQFAAASGDPVFEDGKLVTTTAAGDGVKFALDLEKNFTISVKVKATSRVFAAPVVWVGPTAQPGGGENWIGIWHGFDDNATKGPALGSNDAAGSRVGVLGADGAFTEMDETLVTIVINEGVGSLYYNGTLVGTTADGKTLPDPTSADGCAVYIGCNAWDKPADGTYDNLSVYNRALSAEEVAALAAAGGDPTATGDAPAQTGTPAPTDTPAQTDTPADTGKPTAPSTGFATIALAIVAIGSGAYVVSKKH